MVVKVFGADNFAEYQQLLFERNLELDIYYYPHFLQLDARLQKGVAEIFCAFDDENYFIYPYIKLPFSGLAYSDSYLDSKFDITSPYGYCGPLSSSHDFLRKSEEAFLEHATKEGFVTEFVRYHFSITHPFETNIQNLHNRNILLLDLSLPWDEIWMEQFSATNRNLIRKMEKEGFEFKLSQSETDFSTFFKMYTDTMSHAEAAEFYFFSEDFLKDQFKTMADKIKLGAVVKDGRTYSSMLFFLSGEYATYYLSARNLECGKIPATNFALYQFIKLSKQEGFSIMNLGGGLTLSPDDSLFKFKKNFAKRVQPFAIGKRIVDKTGYEHVKANYAKKHPEIDLDAKAKILQFYR